MGRTIGVLLVILAVFLVGCEESRDAIPPMPGLEEEQQQEAEPPVNQPEDTPELEEPEENNIKQYRIEKQYADAILKDLSTGPKGMSFVGSEFNAQHIGYTYLVVGVKNAIYTDDVKIATEGNFCMYYRAKDKDRNFISTIKFEYNTSPVTLKDKQNTLALVRIDPSNVEYLGLYQGIISITKISPEIDECPAEIGVQNVYAQKSFFIRVKTEEPFTGKKFVTTSEDGYDAWIPYDPIPNCESIGGKCT